MEVEEDQLEISQLMVKIQEEDAKMKRYKVNCVLFERFTLMGKFIYPVRVGHMCL